VPLRIDVRGGGATWSAPAAAGPVGVGPLEVTLADGGSWPTFTWSLANRGERPVAVRAVAVVLAVVGVAEPLRMFRHGYQSWSPSGVATFGVDADPSTRAHFEFLQAVHHADQCDVTAPGELRAEWVTVLADAGGSTVLAGFDAGTEHDGTLRLRRAQDGPGVELWAEAFLGDAVIAPGEQRPLHGIVVDDDAAGGAAALLARWAAAVGGGGGARTGAPYQVGWCSWYHYFDAVTEDDLRANLVLAADWPFEVFQLDDGFQSSIGDWLATNDTFPSGLPALAGAIGAAGRRPGLWLAPFLAAPDSRLAVEHPDWLARRRASPGHEARDSGGGPGDGADPLFVWWNPAWGGGRDGFMYGLDTTNPAVLAHLEGLARALVDMGFTYLKLDFTFAPSVDGSWADPARTPAQRVRAGFDAVRRGAGEGAFLLGCGAPLSHVVGVVDGNRIGPDVAPLWSLDASAEIVPGYLDVQPATRGAYAATVTRSFMHRRLWLNDPDCLMLRATQTALSAEAARTWAHTVGLAGGMAIVSDDLSLLDDASRSLLDDTLTLGRASDAGAIAGFPAAAGDLMEHNPPTVLHGARTTLSTDPDTGSSRLSAP